MFQLNANQHRPQEFVSHLSSFHPYPATQTAAVHRVKAHMEQQASKLTELENATVENVRAATEAEKAVKMAESEEKQAAVELEKAAAIHDKAKKDLEAFTAKFRSFLGPGES